MTNTSGYAALSKGEPLVPYHFNRRANEAHDVAFDIKYCGICHSDLHQVNNDWGSSEFPMVPGHEVIGIVTSVGSSVTQFKIGQRVGVGCMVDSCQACTSCDEHEEQLCEKGATFTYASEDKRSGGFTYGGYSQKMVVNEKFVLSIPDNLELGASAPLLCAGITTYSPLRDAGVKTGTKVAIVGLGGLGHMAVKIAAAMGAEVTVISRTTEKTNDALRLGATALLASSDPAAMTLAENSFDFILDTVSAVHDINALFALLKNKGTLTQVGLPSEALSVSLFPLIFKKLKFTGSLIGGVKETQEMLDFCGKHNITSDIELIKLSKVNTAFERLEKSDVKYRFVIDIENSTF